MVKITIQRGCEIIVIKRGIKPDIKAWLVVFFNNFAGGSGLGIVQCFDRRLKLGCQWERYKHSDGRELSVSKCGGQSDLEAIHRAWLRDCANDDIFGPDGWQAYEACGLLANQLKHGNPNAGAPPPGGGYEAVVRWINASVNNRARPSTLSVFDCIRNMAAMDTLLRVNYQSKTSFSQTRFDIFWYECIKCCIPISESVEQDHVLIFTEFSERMKRLRERLSTPLPDGRSVLVKLKHQKIQKENKKDKVEKKVVKKKATIPPAATKTETAVKKRGKAGKAGQASKNNNEDATESAGENEETENTQNTQNLVEPDEDEQIELRARKDCLFGDDVSEFLNKAAVSLTSRGLVVEAERPDLIALSFRKGLHMLFLEDATDANGATHKKWPHLKKSLFTTVSTQCRELIKDHQAKRDKAATEDAGVVDTMKLMDFSRLLTQEKSNNIKFHEPYNQFVAAVKKHLVQCELLVEDMALNSIVVAITEKLDEVIAPGWILFLSDMLDDSELMRSPLSEVEDAKSEMTAERAQTAKELLAVFNKPNADPQAETQFDKIAILNFVNTRAEYMYSPE